MPDKPDLSLLAQRALDLIPNNSVVGLGTGSAATAFIHALGARVKAGGLSVRGIPTSDASDTLAKQLGIPIIRFEDVEHIDVCFDGADEVDPNGDLVKGWGGALLREKVVAGYAKKFVVLVGPEKLVPVLGTRDKVPVEVVPFALTPCIRHLTRMGFVVTPRPAGDKLYVTDNGNYILDCKTGPIRDPHGTDIAISAIPGVAGTGLFVKRAHVIMIQDGTNVEVRTGSAA
jgi:ribose 5-phosphate isomerase A